MVAVRSFNHALCDGFKVLLTSVLRDFRLGFKSINDAAAPAFGPGETMAGTCALAFGAAAAPELQALDLGCTDDDATGSELDAGAAAGASFLAFVLLLEMFEVDIARADDGGEDRETDAPQHVAG